MKYKSGDQFEDFLLLENCGSGAYGSVFLARNVISGREYALKIIPADSRFSERELDGIRKYQIVCSQSNLMQIYRVGRIDSSFYYVMDAADKLDADTDKYVPDTLQNRIEKYGRINSAELLEIALCLEQCIKTLHTKGLLHRDIKPANIIFVNGQALPGDIGLVSAEKNASLAGTAAFISPATAAGVRPFCQEDDFYALGKTIYCAMTGNLPEKYPAFPRDLELAGCREIIPLYNRWINGSGNKAFAAKKIPYKLLLIIFLLVLSGIFIATGVKTPSVLPEPALNIQDYRRKAENLADVLLPDSELQKILPQLEKRKKDLWSKRTRAGLQAHQRVVAPEHLQEARKNPQWLADPEAYLRIQRKDRAVAEFDRANKNNPVLRYFSTIEWLTGELQRVRLLSRTPGIENIDFSSDFKSFQKKISELEELKKQLLIKKL